MEIIDIDSRTTVKGGQSTTINGNGPVFIYSKPIIMITGKNTNKLFSPSLPTKNIDNIQLVINSHGPTYIYSNGSVTVNGDGYVSMI